MMHGRRELLMLGAAGLAAAAAGFLVGPLLLQPAIKGRADGNTTAGDGVLFSTNLVDLTGQPRQVSEWKDRILVCNFWATWCGPCREEIPLLIAARRKYAGFGLEIVGIAVDNPAKVREFTASLGISYPVLLAEVDGLDMMRKLGNSAGALPYTVIADRQGSIINRKLGAFHPGDLDAILGPMTRT